MRNEERPPYSGCDEKARPARSAGIDYFRMAAAFMVIAIHIAPFSGWNQEIDFLLTYCLGRTAVPFFFMTTGYFVLAPYVKSGFRKKRSFGKYMVKNTVLYLAAAVLYLPLTIYSGNLPKNVGEWGKALVFDGTFYHLWYFPAVLLGCLLVVWMLGSGRSLRFSAGAAAAYAAASYLIGLFGDSYYGAVKGTPWIKAVYGAIFQVSSFTRNGIFFAPIFLMMGVGIALTRRRLPKKICVWGLTLSLVLLMGEGLLTYGLKWQRHNSMYFFLAPAMYFLFQLLLMIPGKAPAFCRKYSLILYVVHPAVIVILRGLAQILGLTEFLVDNTFVQYITVCLGTLLAAYLYMELKERVVSFVK